MLIFAYMVGNEVLLDIYLNSGRPKLVKAKKLAKKGPKFFKIENFSFFLFRILKGMLKQQLFIINFFRIFALSNFGLFWPKLA